MEYQNNLAPIIAAAASAFPSIMKKLKNLSAITKKVSAFGVKFGIGGVKDERFIKRRDAIKDLFQNNGYTPKGYLNQMKKFKIDQANIPDRKSDSYKAEYKRLYQWCVAVLNEANPGLGDLYKTYFEGFPMANKGSMISEPYQGLRIFVETFPPGKWKPGMLPPEPQNKEVVTGNLTPEPVETIKFLGLSETVL